MYKLAGDYFEAVILSSGTLLQVIVLEYHDNALRDIWKRLNCSQKQKKEILLIQYG